MCIRDSLKGLANRGQGECTRGRCAGPRHPCEEACFDARVKAGRRRRVAIGRFDPSARKDEMAGHESVCQMPPSEQHLRLISAAINQDPVSYTHLDVYKRQMPRKAPGRRAGTAERRIGSATELWIVSAGVARDRHH